MVCQAAVEASCRCYKTAQYGSLQKKKEGNHEKTNPNCTASASRVCSKLAESSSVHAAFTPRVFPLCYPDNKADSTERAPCLAIGNREPSPWSEMWAARSSAPVGGILLRYSYSIIVGKQTPSTYGTTTTVEWQLAVDKAAAHTKGQAASARARTAF